MASVVSPCARPWVPWALILVYRRTANGCFVAITSASPPPGIEPVSACGPPALRTRTIGPVVDGDERPVSSTPTPVALLSDQAFRLMAQLLVVALPAASETASYYLSRN